MADAEDVDVMAQLERLNEMLVVMMDSIDLLRQTTASFVVCSSANLEIFDEN